MPDYMSAKCPLIHRRVYFSCLTSSVSARLYHEINQQLYTLVSYNFFITIMNNLLLYNTCLLYIFYPLCIYMYIQGVLFNLRHRSNSKPWRFRWECFKQKFYGFKGAIRWCHWFYLEKSFEGHVKVTTNFLNGTPYILLHILIACLESFPKHYN